MFYLITVQTMKEDGAEARTVQGFANRDDAEKAFHVQLGYDINNPVLKSVMCMVVTESCQTLMGKHWVAAEGGEE